jgi:hypothetical protein
MTYASSDSMAFHQPAVSSETQNLTKKVHFLIDRSISFFQNLISAVFASTRKFSREFFLPGKESVKNPIGKF